MSDQPEPFPCPQPDCAMMCDGACIARARRLDDEDDEPMTVEAGPVSAETRALIAKATGGSLSRDLPVVFVEEDSGDYLPRFNPQMHTARSVVERERAAYERGIAEGRRQATEGWGRYWGLHHDGYEVVAAPSREAAARLGEDDPGGTVVSRLVGPWEPAEQPEPAPQQPTTPLLDWWDNGGARYVPTTPEGSDR